MTSPSQLILNFTGTCETAERDFTRQTRRHITGSRAQHAKRKRETPHQPIRQASVSSIRAPAVTPHANTNCTPSPLYHAEPTSPCSPLDPSPAPRLARHLPAPLPAPAAATTAPRAPSSSPDPRTTSSTASVPTSLSTLLNLESSGASCRSSKYLVTWGGLRDGGGHMGQREDCGVEGINGSMLALESSPKKSY
jgi:hypothetical protein